MNSVLRTRKDDHTTGTTRRHSVRINGTDVAYEVRGNGTRAVVYLGGTLSMDPATDDFIDGLVIDGHQVIVPMLPGYGEGALPAGCTSVLDVALIVDSILEHLGIGDAFVVGEAFGGWVALEMAVNYGTRIGGLVLISPWGVRLQGREGRDFMHIYTADPAELARALYGEQAGMVETHLTGLPVEELERYARAETSLGTLVWSPYLHDRRLSAWRQRLKTITCLISSPDDAFARAGYYSELADWLGVAEHVEIPGAPHLVRYAGKEPVLEAISRFIRSNEGR